MLRHRIILLILLVFLMGGVSGRSATTLFAGQYTLLLGGTAASNSTAGYGFDHSQ